MPNDRLQVLLVNRHLNIGGVETYLCRLAAGLVARGHGVGILTEGGRYEAWAAKSGATLHKVPSLRTDWSGAVSRLQDAGYDIVHAHNYHSARVGRRLAEKLSLPYLMSVHGPRPRLKQLFFRDWSDEVIVMSEGDADNIQWWGGCGERPVILSFYGIDTERFHPGIDASPLRAELGLQDTCRCVGFVSRFSNRKADVGLAFLESLPALAERIPSIRGLIVGEGPEAQRLSEAVLRVNARAGRPIALMVGPRTDIERVFALCEVAICTANTALESLACGTPTLAAGRTGYFGPVTVARFQEARALCFADHGRSPEPLSAALFRRDLVPMLDDRDAASAVAGACARMIASEYGVARMAEDMEKIYKRTLERDKKRN